MDTRWTRILGGSTVAAILLASFWAAPAFAADCTLVAPATVALGTSLTIDGAGFPASSGVAVKLTVGGGNPDDFTVQSNASGAFQINLTPEASDVGKTTVVATAGSVCSAQVAYTVLAAGQTAAPSDDPVGSADGTTSAPLAPQTDLAGRDVGMPSTQAAWLLAILVLGIGAVGLILTRAPRRR